MKMILNVVVLMLLISVVTSYDPITRDLIEEAESQLEQLRSLVELDIFVALYDLEELQEKFEFFSNKIYQTAVINLYQEQTTIESYLSSIKHLAESSGKDISSCINGREDTLGQMLSYYDNETNHCIVLLKLEALMVTQNSRYIVDTTINKVHDLENQYRRCNEDLLCVSSLITEVRLYKAKLPQEIQTQMLHTQEILSEMELLVNGCSDQNVAEYVSEANIVIKEIQECVDIIAIKK